MARDHNGSNVGWLSDCPKFNYHQLLRYLTFSPCVIHQIFRNQNSHNNDNDHLDTEADDIAHHYDPAYD